MPDQQNRIDRYEVQEVIGRGAMGVVYRALDPVIGRVVALKTIRMHDGAFSQAHSETLVRFAREARAAGLLSHPNIVTIYDIGEVWQEGGTASYIAMEFVEGRTLRQMVPHGDRLSPDEILDIALQLARALDYAHRRGIVHRDVKPANVLVREDGLVKLTDFGVARIETSELTRTGQSVGSPSYMAPEVLLDQPVDGRSDLFSLGVILYELLAGDKPFRGETLAALYHQVIAVTPTPPSHRNPAVPPAWDALIMRLLAKKPQDRYASAGALIEALRRFERGQPLDLGGESASGCTDPALLEDEEERESVLERVIQEEAKETLAGHRDRAHQVFPAQVKALMALLTVTGFALAVILGAALLREPGRQDSPRAGAAGSAAADPAPARLTVRLAHNLRAGRLNVMIDGNRFLGESFQGERSRMRIQGAFARSLEVPQGRHIFRVTVQDETGRSWSKTTSRELAEGRDATLFIEVKGILKKSLSLTWY